MLDQLLTTKQAATVTGLSVAWFERKRWEGGGPPFVKFDRAVRYRESDLAAWIEAHTQKSNSTPPVNRA
jgi:predicted DNA-binding transcriptional regulator AlpA